VDLGQETTTEKEAGPMADKDNGMDWVSAGALGVIYAFAIAGAVCVAQVFAAAAKGEGSPLEAIAFLVILLGFCTGSLAIVGIGCLLEFVGVCHTKSMAKGR
jgi:hypothetical protein